MKSVDIGFKTFETLFHLQMSILLEKENSHENQHNSPRMSEKYHILLSHTQALKTHWKKTEIFSF